MRDQWVKMFGAVVWSTDGWKLLQVTSYSVEQLGLELSLVLKKFSESYPLLFLIIVYYLTILK